jgi:hypothetical protein
MYFRVVAAGGDSLWRSGVFGDENVAGIHLFLGLLLRVDSLPPKITISLRNETKQKIHLSTLWSSFPPSPPDNQTEIRQDGQYVTENALVAMREDIG